MARYIDADALKEVLTKLADDPWNANAGTTWAKAYDYCIEYLDEQPTADVRENIKGEWKPFDLTWGRSVYSCSACGNAFEVPTDMGKPMYKFCPNCGAKMKGEEDETD